MKVIIFAETYFEEAYDYSTILEARAFARGVSCGGNLYGAGSCHAYVLPEDEEEMREQETPQEVERALNSLASPTPS